MKREPTPTAGELAEGLRRAVPRAGRGLCDAPCAGCTITPGKRRRCAAWRKPPPRGSCSPPCGRGDRPEFLALAAWRLVAERKNRTRENER